MRIWRENWCWVGGIIFIGLAFFMGFWGVEHLDHIQVILIFSWMAMLAHQVEEYGWPGGFPAVTNILFFKEKKDYDHYPFNPHLCFFDNVFTTYAFYIIPIFFPNVIWLAIGQACAGFIQVLAHDIFENIALKTKYNPGAATAIFLQLPIGIYMLWYVTVNNMASVSDYILGAVFGIVGYALVFGVPVLMLRDRNSKYHFTEKQMYGFRESVEVEAKRILAEES